MPRAGPVVVSQKTDRYAALHAEFQDAHSKYDDVGAGLYLAHWVGELGAGASVSKVWNGGFEVIGKYPIPIISPADIKYIEAAPHEPSDRAFGQDIIRQGIQRDCVAFMPSPKGGDVKLAELGAAEFRRLADKAGRMLPMTIRNVLPWQFEPSGFAGRWLGAMFWHNPPNAWELLSYNRPCNGKGYEHFEFHPFSESADVIEDFGLLDGSPRLRTSDGDWPVWAGFPLTDQPSVKGDETEPPNAVLVLQELLNDVIPKRAHTQRRAVELLIDYQGRLPIADLAKDDKIDWTLEEWDNNVSSLLPRLKKHLHVPWSFVRDDNAIVVTFNRKPVKK